MVDTIWLEQASLEDVAFVFPDAIVGVKDRGALLRAAAEVENKLQRDAEDLYVLECALVAETGRIGEENNAFILIRDIEEYFLLRDLGDDLSNTVLSIAMEQSKALAEKYRTDPVRLTELDEKLRCINGYIGWILFGMEKEPQRCPESIEYYRKMKAEGHAAAAQITEYRMLLCDEPGKPRVHAGTIRSLHDMSIFELHALLEQGENTKKVIELQRAAELENAWYYEPDVDLCDKWLLLDVSVGNKSILGASKYAVEGKKPQKVTVPNALNSKLNALKEQMTQLEPEADRLNDPKAKPGRFWRALLAILLCGAMMYLSWGHPERFAEVFEGGFGIVYALAGYAFAAGLLGGGLLYGLLFFFLSGFVMLYLIVAGGLLDGRIPVYAGITTTVFCSMGICILFLLWRAWTSRHALRSGGGKQKAFVEQLQAVARAAEAGSGCCGKLAGSALRLKADEAYKRYHGLEVQFNEIRKRAQKYL